MRRTAALLPVVLWLGLGETPIHPPELAARPLCSLAAVLEFRRDDMVTFIGTPRRDTLRASIGTVAPSTGSGHSGRALPRPTYGQLIRVSEIGKPWQKVLPVGTKNVLLIPWDYGADCSPLYWSQSAQAWQPGVAGLFQAHLRDRAAWIDGTPVLDVFAPEFTPYPTAAGYLRDLEFAEEEHGRRPDLLDPVDMLRLSELLPTEVSMDLEPDSAIAPVLAWAAAHPALAAQWPAVDVIARLQAIVPEVKVRQIASPIAGTYRVVTTFDTGDSVVLFSRTELRASSMINARRQEDVTRSGQPIVGYHLHSEMVASEPDLPTSRTGRYASSFAVSTVPAREFPDSTLWHGYLSPIVEVHFLAPSENLRAYAKQQFKVEEDVPDDWYYLPGLWTTYRDGRARFDWQARSGDHVFYTVRADRISSTTLQSSR